MLIARGSSLETTTAHKLLAKLFFASDVSRVPDCAPVIGHTLTLKDTVACLICARNHREGMWLITCYENEVIIRNALSGVHESVLKCQACRAKRCAMP